MIYHLKYSDINEYSLIHVDNICQFYYTIKIVSQNHCLYFFHCNMYKKRLIFLLCLHIYLKNDLAHNKLSFTNLNIYKNRRDLYFFEFKNKINKFKKIQISSRTYLLLATKQIVVCPITLRRKENTGTWMRILMSFSNFNDIQKDNPCAVCRTNGRKRLQMFEQELSIQPEVSWTSGSRRNEWMTKD